MNNEPTGRLLLNLFRKFESAALTTLATQGFADVTLSHLNVLRHLNPEGMRQVALAKDAGLSKQAVGAIVKELEVKGYLQVVPDDTDGRAHKVIYTAKGKRWLDAAIRVIAAIENDYRLTLGETRYQQLRDDLILLLKD
ncbi:MAG: MarR family transcriptional regulator [Gammaproteobacteria bacterium]|nr:MarR family transcriptional regulator [Gammaproteobacteria bacterium]